MGRIRKFEEYKKLNRRIQERNKRRRNMTSKEEKEKAKSSGGRVKHRSRGVQEE